MSDLLNPVSLLEDLGIPAEDWQQTPLSVRLAVFTLLKSLEALESRLHQNSSNSSRPSSTDSQSTKCQRRRKVVDERDAWRPRLRLIAGGAHPSAPLLAPVWVTSP